MRLSSIHYNEYRDLVIGILALLLTFMLLELLVAGPVI